MSQSCENQGNHAASSGNLFNHHFGTVPFPTPSSDNEHAAVGQLQVKFLVSCRGFHDRSFIDGLPSKGFNFHISSALLLLRCRHQGRKETIPNNCILKRFFDRHVHRKLRHA